MWRTSTKRDMATIKIISNLSEVTDRIREKISVLKNPEYLLRPVCFDLVDLMTQRIHIDGRAVDGPIGTYNSVYLKERQRKYQRSADTKVIVSLTRQLENDWAVIAVPNGYGIGFNNQFNIQKMRWVEEIKQKSIGALSSSEREFARDRIQELVQEALRA